LVFNFIRNLWKGSKTVILSLFLTVSSGIPAAAQSPIVWLAPRHQPPIPAPDFMNLFLSNAPWPKAAARVQVLKLFPQFVHSASDADLQTVFVNLQERRIALAIEYGLLDPGDPLLCGGKGPQCGQVEGFGGAFLAGDLARIKSLGGNLQLVAMDEPLWFGNYSTEPGASQAPIWALAHDIAKQVAIVHGYFPSAVVGDIEPVVGALGTTNWVQEIAQWANAYQQQVGLPLAFFHSDVAWQQTGSASQLTQLRSYFHGQGIPFGIIYDGDFSDSAVQWTTDAEWRFANIESNSGAVPDDAIFESWHPQPLYALPETEPGTMTYLVDRYMAAETIINATKTNTGFTGSVTSQGKPVPGVQLFAYAVDDGTLNITTRPSLTNTVPSGAVNALIALRINVECECNGSANILLGTTQYLDTTSNTAVTTTLVPQSQRIVVPIGQTLAVNSASFAVTPGDTFSALAPMQLPYSSNNSGYVAIVFLDRAGAEIERQMLPFQAGRELIWANTTNQMGQFTITAKLLSSITTFEFNGNTNLRVSSLTLTD
jgi:hypothetical protein